MQLSAAKTRTQTTRRVLDLEHARERNVARHPSGDEAFHDLGSRGGGCEVFPDPCRPLGREDVHFFAGFFALAAGFAEAEADALALAVIAADAVAEAVVVIAGVDAVVAVDDGIAAPVSVGIADEPVLDGIAESVGGVCGGFGGSPPHAAAMIEAAERVTNGMTNGRELVRRAAFFMGASLYAAAARCEHHAHFDKQNRSGRNRSRTRDFVAFDPAIGAVFEGHQEVGPVNGPEAR